MNTSAMSFPLFVASLVLFGTNGVVADGIGMSSYQIVFMRTLFGSLLLIVAFLVIGGRYRIPENRVESLYLLISGISMGVSWIFLYEAYRLVGVSIASLEYYCGPALVMILSPWLFSERLTAVKTAGFLVVCTGAVLMCAEGISGDAEPMGHVYGLLSAVAHAAMVIFSKKAEHIDGLENSSLQLLYSFLTVAVFVIVIGDFPTSVAADDWFPILVLGFANTGLGCLLYFSTITHLSAQTVSIWGYLEPMSAVVFATLVLGERMTSLEILGAVLIFAGAMAADYVSLKRTKNNVPAL